MQFRAGILYVVLFVVVAAGAYGVIATAESPHVTVDEGNADHVLEVGEEFDVDGQTFNVSGLSDGSGTVEYVNESAVLEVEWSGQGDNDWDAGDSVRLSENEDDEYTVMLLQPDAAEDGGDGGNESSGNESSNEDGTDGNESEEANGDGGAGNESEGATNGSTDPQAFLLIETVEDDEYDIIEQDGEPKVIVSEGETDELVPITEFDEIDTQRYEVGDDIEFYNEDEEEMIEGEVTEITSEGVTVEYVGTAVDEYDLENAETVTLNDQDFGVYHPSDEEVYLTSDVSSFESQQADVEEFGTRIQGLWWVVVMSVFTAVVIGGLAFMPVRG